MSAEARRLIHTGKQEESGGERAARKRGELILSLVVTSVYNRFVVWPGFGALGDYFEVVHLSPLFLFSEFLKEPPGNLLATVAR